MWHFYGPLNDWLREFLTSCDGFNFSSFALCGFLRIQYRVVVLLEQLSDNWTIFLCY